MPFGWPHVDPPHPYLSGNGRGCVCDPGGGFGTDELVVSLDAVA